MAMVACDAERQWDRRLGATGDLTAANGIGHVLTPLRRPAPFGPGASSAVDDFGADQY
jgi:hypothetical protein